MQLQVQEARLFLCVNVALAWLAVCLRCICYALQAKYGPAITSVDMNIQLGFKLEDAELESWGRMESEHQM